MKKNYCISGISALKHLPVLDLAQFTLNSRTFPSKRRTVEALNVLRTADKCDLPLIIHEDFVYIISRYHMFSKDVQSAIIGECTDIIRYSSCDPNVLGIIMHTDYPLAREVKDAEAAKKHYAASIWDKKRICDDLDKDMVELSVVEFYKDLKSALKLDRGCKVFLENTTKIGPNDEGTVQYLTSLFEKHPEFRELFGICYDTEHDAAISGKYASADDIIALKNSGFDVICHLNCIPENAPMGDRKDRHSETTIYECSVNSADFYKSYTGSLDAAGIPWVREVHEDTMFRELEQCKF